MSSSGISSTDWNSASTTPSRSPRATVCSFASQPGREGVNKGSGPASLEDESADVRDHGCGAGSNDATMRMPVHTHRLPAAAATVSTTAATS
jgi:hypothetical protein